MKRSACIHVPVRAAGAGQVRVEAHPVTPDRNPRGGGIQPGITVGADLGDMVAEGSVLAKISDEEQRYMVAQQEEIRDNPPIGPVANATRFIGTRSRRGFKRRRDDAAPASGRVGRIVAPRHDGVDQAPVSR